MNLENGRYPQRTEVRRLVSASPQAPVNDRPKLDRGVGIGLHPQLGTTTARDCTLNSTILRDLTASINALNTIRLRRILKPLLESCINLQVPTQQSAAHTAKARHPSPQCPTTTLRLRPTRRLLAMCRFHVSRTFFQYSKDFIH